MSVTRIFTFGHGQTCPMTGKNLLGHHAGITAPTAELCRKAMFQMFEQQWSFEYASLAEATRDGQFPSLEHIRITFPSISPGEVRDDA
jgi:hypothetical protein